MPTPPLLVDGRPRPAALFLAVHDAFRRDAARLAGLAPRIADPEHARRAARHWELYEGMLVSHHHAEDAGLFPALVAEAPHLAGVVAELEAEHAVIDPLLERIGAALEALPDRGAEAAEAFAQLASLLETHLGREEEHLVPVMERTGLAPTGAEEEDDHEPAWWEALALPWVADGLPADVVGAVLPPPMRDELPALQVRYADHVRGLW